MRTQARHDQRGVAAFGQGDDRLHAREVVGGVHGRQGDAFVATLEGGVQAVAGLLAGRVLFSAQADAGHGLNGFDRVRTCSTFSRQHHRVGIVQHGVGHVGHFGTGRHRVLDHRLHHLGRHDHRFVVAAGVLDDLLLDGDQLGVADFHAQVATGDHDGVGCEDQLVEGLVVGHRFGAFDLGHQPGAAASFVTQLACVFHVAGVTREGHGQVVQVHFRRQLDVSLVFFGQGRCGQAATFAVDAFVVRQRATDDHHAVQGICSGGFDAHDHAAIVQQQFVTDAAVLDQVGVVDTDDVLVAFGQRVGGREGELVTDLQFDALVGELGDADLRTLQVAQQCNMAAVLGGDVTDQARAGLVLVRSAVGEVQACHVQAGEDQLFDHFRRVAGGAKGGDDFGTADAHAQTPIVKRSERLLLNLAVVIVPLHYLRPRQGGI